ncbi:hypothetical protein D7Y27_19280 [Corallococcus sp. AB004]|nr:hypothetical protein D7Y27_19280 [Corallococcus sp. AB004]
MLPSVAATVEEPRKERTLRLDWAGLLKRTFALDVDGGLLLKRVRSPRAARAPDRASEGISAGPS